MTGAAATPTGVTTIDIVAMGSCGLLALVHLAAGKLRFLDVVPRSGWLSFAGGISVAYVFVHLLPELAAGQEVIADAAAMDWLAAEADVWLVVLAGVCVFYALERMVRRSASGEDADGDRATGAVERHVFWLHISSYGLYNVIVGYLLVRRESAGVRELLLFGVAMALHFLVNDYGLRQHHRERYAGVGRWVLAAAVVAGTATGFAVDVSEATVAVLLAFLGGGVVLNVLKEELPEERCSRVAPFVVGAALYATLLVLA